MRGREDEGTEMRKKAARGGEAERGKQKARRSRQTRSETKGGVVGGLVGWWRRVIARGSFLHT